MSVQTGGRVVFQAHNVQHCSEYLSMADTVTGDKKVIRKAFARSLCWQKPVLAEHTELNCTDPVNMMHRAAYRDG